MTTYGRGFAASHLSTVATITIALALVFFYAPLDADQGFVQKIFYIHVPLAIVSLCGFVLGGIFAVGTCAPGPQLGHALLRRDPHGADLLRRRADHGSIWAKASWGHWWVWNEPTLVSFLIVVLLFATYQPLRFSIEDPERQARYASVFAIVAGAFVPLNFIAVRLAQGLVHPRVLTLDGGHLPGSMRLTFTSRCSGSRCCTRRCGSTRWRPRTRACRPGRCGGCCSAMTRSPCGAPPLMSSEQLAPRPSRRRLRQG